jgi:Asp-tRNA(Asn)/Glu-tRNA(Gln) amidotransferase A subunit family amidase
MALAHLAAGVREGLVTSHALVGSSFERIDRLDGPVNAIVSTRDDDALADAAAIDARVAAGEDPGPLAGLPLLVKDNEDCAGLPTTYGSLLYRDAPPAERDCEAVARLRAAGAVVVGKTNLPEFALEGFTSNRSFGDTHNPWALDWSPGGSSGGSGAALAMGLAPLATATDGGGSIRIPAAFCGLVGFKPTNGLVGRDPVPSWIDLSTKGPLAISVADAALLLEVLRGPAAGDPTALSAWTPREDAWPRRLLVAPRMADHGPLPESIEALFVEAVTGMEAATGLAAERIDPLLAAQADDDWFTMVGVEELTWIGRGVVADRAEELSVYLRGALEFAATFSVDDYLVARRRRFEMVKVIDRLLGDDAVLICPTMCVEGFYADGRMLGREEPGTDPPAYNTQIANITGHPALSVPAGRSPNGVPFGIQITGPRYADDLVLAVGAAWEVAYPWPLAAPGFEPFGP